MAGVFGAVRSRGRVEPRVALDDEWRGPRALRELYHASSATE